MPYMQTKSTRNAIFSVAKHTKTLDIAFLHHFRPTVYYMLAVVAITLLSTIAIASTTYADNVDFSVTIAPSLNVTIPTNIVSLNLNPANSAFSSQDLIVSVGTNNITGYTLTMTADSTDLTRTEAVGSTTPTISTLANEVAENEFTANRWGYRFSDNTTNTNYQPFATSIPFNESDSAVNNDARTITFGAKVNTEQAPGTYELALVFTAVANPGLQSLVINFDEGVESVAVKTGSATGTTVGTVSTSGGAVNGLAYNTAYYLVPTYASGKGLSAWSQPSGTVGTLSCVATSTCDTDETPYYTTGDGTNAVILASKNKLYLQDVTSSTCPETATLVYDSRDEEKYMIQKLADEKCWMLDNLRLGSTSSMTLKNTDTNITASTYTLPASISSGFNSYTAAQINTASKATNATYSSNITSSSFNDNNTAKIGVYYNYYAATAGGIRSSSNSSNASADRDICPKGWRMPTGGSSGEYQALYTAYSSDNVNFQTALRTPLSGYFSNSNAYNWTHYGYFWSATRYNSTSMYRLYVSVSDVYPQSNYDRNYGYSVRCVLK